jgi:hypothetical protein
LGVAGALVAGLVIAPLGGTASAAGSSDPSFYPVSADAVKAAAGPDAARHAVVARTSSQRIAAKAAVAKKTQILQVVKGIGATGEDGVSVAAGPKQTVQAAGGTIRVIAKNTGAQVKKGQKSASKFFRLGGGVLVTQPTVVYDPVGKRFIAVGITKDGGDVGLAMRISKGTAAAPLTNKKWHATVAFGSNAASDPNGDVDEWNPKIGVSSDKIVVTTAADDPTNATIANRLFFFPKAAYYKGNEPGAWAADVDSTYDGLAPAVNSSKQSNAFVAIPDTDDVTVTTYTGAAKSNAPGFSKNVVYPSTSMAAPPNVVQTGGATLDLGGLEFSGVAWRSNKLYAAATVNIGGNAGIRVFGINTGAGVSLNSDSKNLLAGNDDWFDPDLAIDGGGNVIVTAQNEGSTANAGPSVGVFVRKSNSDWITAARYVDKSDGPVAGGTIDWWNSTGAAADPTSPWDVWVSGSVGPDQTTVARVSIAKNKATIKASSTKVKKGSKVTFTVKLTRPDSKDTIKGLPVALQKSPKSKNKFKTVKSGKTSAKGTARWKLSVKSATKYRTLGKAKKQNGGAGTVFDKVTSKPVTVNLK